MTKPTPEPIAPAELVERALAVIRADRFPQLATIDGDTPRVRPVSPVRTDRFTVYVANLRAYHKTAEIAANPRVELQDGPTRTAMIARELSGDERQQWWERAVAAYPPYAEYQTRTSRQIPVFVLEPATD